MSPRLIRRCRTCGRALSAPEVAAEVHTPATRQWWCVTCWDTDEVALGQYQFAQTMARPSKKAEA